MNNKKVVIGVIVAIAVVCVAILVKSPASKGVLKTSVMPAMAKSSVKIPGKMPAKAPVKAPAVKTFQKDMGGLTVKMLNSKSKETPVRIMAFKAVDEKSGIYAATLTANRMQDLPEGSYAFVIDTVPQKLYKDIKVRNGTETVTDIGATGSVNIKALNSKKKDASISVKIMHQKSSLMVAAANTNRPFEIVPGIYNIEIETLPRQAKNDIKIEGGKETVLDLGVVSGALIV